MIKIKVKEFSEPSICQKLWLFDEEYIKLTERKKEDSIE